MSRRWRWKPTHPAPSDENCRCQNQFGMDDCRRKSGGGPPQSKTLARFPTISEPREASWSAPALWRFGWGRNSTQRRKDAKPKKTGTPKSFWYGRLEQAAFELGMTKEENNLQTISVESGLVAFFDILGYKKMLLANSVEKSLHIVNDCLLKALAETEKTNGTKLKMETFVISDSILIALRSLTNAGVFLFTMFCNRFIFELLISGLPARGAIATGKFSIQTKENQIIFVGQPIVDAHELANSLEMAACALAPSSESKILNDSTRELFQIHDTPIKNLPACKLYLLKYGIGFSREQIIQHFEDHNKHLDANSFNKLNNTIEFLKECGELKPI